MVNVNVLSMEELSTSLETIGWKLFSFASRLEKMACKIQCQKKVSFRFCIDKYSISAFVFVLTHLLSSPFKTDLSDFTGKTSQNIAPYLCECSTMAESRRFSVHKSK